jgi:hypothetical protein
MFVVRFVEAHVKVSKKELLALFNLCTTNTLFSNIYFNLVLIYLFAIFNEFISLKGFFCLSQI